MKEEWKPIPGYEGLYEVSDQGRVRSLNREVKDSMGRTRRRKGRILNLPARRNGYLQAMLYKNGTQRTKLVHRLVLEAFIGPPKEGQEACHNDGSRDNNRLENLRWGTHTENVADTKKHGRNHNLNTTHCPQGHKYTPENTYTHRVGGRQCRACRAIRSKERYAREKKNNPQTS